MSFISLIRLRIYEAFLYAFVGQSIGLVGQKETYSSDSSDLASQTVCNIYDSKAFLHIFTLSIDHYRRWQCKDMETKILRVVRQGEAFSVQSQKAESGQIQKCNIVLRELGGSKFENEYVCSMLGSLAGCRFYEGDVVAATLRFSTHEYQGQVFQEILATDIVKISK